MCPASPKEIVEIATRFAAQEEELLAMVYTDAFTNWDGVQDLLLKSKLR